MSARAGWRQRQAKLFKPRTGPVFWVSLIAVVVLITLLMRQALYVLGDGGDNWRQVELETALKRFGDTAMLAHAEWFRQGRGDSVEIRIGEQNRRLRLTMSDSGWPLPTGFDGSMDAEQCLALWHELLAGERIETELQAQWQPQAGTTGWHGSCQYRAAATSGQGMTFRYQVHSGHLSVAGAL